MILLVGKVGFAGSFFIRKPCLLRPARRFSQQHLRTLLLITLVNCLLLIVISYQLSVISYKLSVICCLLIIRIFVKDS